MSPQSSVNLKILCIDDEPDITFIIRKALEKQGWHVDTLNDPQQALSQFQPNYYDIIILDVRMPVMNGFQVAKQIWTKDEKARICFLTAFEIHEAEAKKVFKDFKRHSFFKKPIKPADLVEHIRSACTDRIAHYE